MTDQSKDTSKTQLGKLLLESLTGVLTTQRHLSIRDSSPKLETCSPLDELEWTLWAP